MLTCTCTIRLVNRERIVPVNSYLWRDMGDISSSLFCTARCSIFHQERRLVSFRARSVDHGPVPSAMVDWISGVWCCRTSRKSSSKARPPPPPKKKTFDEVTPATPTRTGYYTWDQSRGVDLQISQSRSTRDYFTQQVHAGQRGYWFMTRKGSIAVSPASRTHELCGTAQNYYRKCIRVFSFTISHVDEIPRVPEIMHFSGEKGERKFRISSAKFYHACLITPTALSETFGQERSCVHNRRSREISER